MYHLETGIRWDVELGISEAEINILINGGFLQRLYSRWRPSPVVITSSDGHRVVYFERKIIRDDGSMSDPLLMTVHLEDKFTKRFGFRPERIVKTPRGVVPWSQYWAEVGRRFEALPKPQFRSFE